MRPHQLLIDRLASLTDDPDHALEPAVGTGALRREVLGYLGMGEDQEPLLADALDDRLGDIARLEYAPGQQRGGTDRVLERELEHRSVDGLGTQARDLDAGVRV